METRPQTTYNRFAIAAAALAILSVAALFLFSVSGLAIFAVGAGHLALEQIKETNVRGREMAYVGLGVGYAIALWSVFTLLRLLL